MYAELKRKEWRKRDKKKNPKKYADYEFKRGLRRNYNLTVEQYNKMLEQQKHCCAICGKHASKFKRRLHVDHDHKTGQIRALLCTKCNPTLGYIDESPELLDKIRHYLEKFKKSG